MPFELGMDWGCRHYYGDGREAKRFLILEEKPFRFRAAISDLSGCDIKVHGGDFARTMKTVRYWLREQTGRDAPGPTQLVNDDTTFSEWEYEDKLGRGYSEADIREYPTFERLEAMRAWLDAGMPAG